MKTTLHDKKKIANMLKNNVNVKFDSSQIRITDSFLLFLVRTIEQRDT